MAAVEPLDDLDAHDLAAEADTAIAQIRAALLQLERVSEVLVDRDALAAVCVDLRDVFSGPRSEAGLVFDAFKSALLSEAGDKSFDVPNLGRFEVRRQTKRTGWRHDELVPVLVAKAAEERHFNGSSGEVESEGAAVARVLRECISFGAGKTTGLRARGVQVDEFCSVGEDVWDVQLPGRAA